MSRICKCTCCDKVKIVEENLLLLQNLLVKKDLLIEGNVVVKGKITNDGQPNLGFICTTGITSVDSLGAILNLGPCLLIVQGPQTTLASRVIYGPQTPNGTYLVINYSSQATISVENVDNPTPVFVIRAVTNNEPVVARLVIRDGVLVQRSIVSPPGVGAGSPGCVASGPNGRVFGAPQCAVTFPDGRPGFLFTQTIGVISSSSTIIVESDTTGLLRIINRSLQQNVNVLSGETAERIFVVQPNTQADLTLQNGQIIGQQIIPL